jgi:hypothetical protein
MTLSTIAEALEPSTISFKPEIKIHTATLRDIEHREVQVAHAFVKFYLMLKLMVCLRHTSSCSKHCVRCIECVLYHVTRTGTIESLYSRYSALREPRNPSPSIASNFVQDIENQSLSSRLKSLGHRGTFPESRRQFRRQAKLAPKQLPNVSLTLCSLQRNIEGSIDPGSHYNAPNTSIRDSRAERQHCAGFKPAVSRRTEQCPATLRASLPSIRFIPAA